MKSNFLPARSIFGYAISIVSLLLMMAQILYSSFYYRFAFNYETYENGQYFAVLMAVAGLSIIWGALIFQRNDDRINNRKFLSISAITILLLLLLFSNTYGFGNEYWTMILVTLILYGCLQLAGLSFIKFLFYFIVVILLWQLVIAFEQMDGFEFEANALTIQGSLQNSGVFSCYLVVHLPIMYYMAFGKSDRVTIPPGLSALLKWTGALCFLIILAFVIFIVYRSRCRSALIAMPVAAISWILLSHGRKIKEQFLRIPLWMRVTGAVLIFSGMTSCAFYLFQIKKASAFGRMMKWEIAWQHIGDHFFTGTGIGRFTWFYPQWQAQYFAGNVQPSQEYFLSAGEGYIIFNEYLQLFETIGLAGFAVFGGMLYWFFSARSIRHKRLLTTTKVTVLTLLATGLTTYAFHINILLVLLAICFAIVAVIRDGPSFVDRINPLPASYRRPIPILLFLLSAYTSVVAWQQWEASRKWAAARESRTVDDPSVWRSLYKTLGRDGKFLTEYGAWQLENGFTGPAITTLENARQYFISRSTIELLSEAYDLGSDYTRAIEYRRWLCDYLPNRFVPRYELMALYQKTMDSINEMKTAHAILAMPVKLPSPEVDRIKAAAGRTVDGK